MLNWLKKKIKILLERFDFVITRKSIEERSDDPIEIIKALFYDIEIHTIIDGGASVGDTSLRFANAFPKANVHSFEPYPKFFNFLKDKAKLNDRIIAYPNALSNECGQKKLSINECEGTNSLLPSKTNRLIYKDLLKNKGVILVNTTTIDHLFSDKSIDVLKLDLQGGEYDALKGANKTISKRKIEVILCEIMFEKHYKGQKNWIDIIQFIENNGYTFFNFYQPNFHLGKLLQADFVFVNNKSSILNNLKLRHSFHQFSNLLK